MNKIIQIMALFLLIGCSKGGSLDRLLNGRSGEPVAHKSASYIVACCQDNNMGTITYPAFLPQSQVDLCNLVRTSHGVINGDTYIAMHVGCGQGHGYKGDEFYPAAGY